MVNVFAVNAFTKNNSGGNPAGVCLNADSLNEQQMQSIAAKVDFSETAFVQKSNVADFKVRFFTPVSEVPLCGHATIATFHTLFTNGLIKSGKYSQETKAGVLEIEVNRGEVFMQQNLPKYLGEINREEVASCLGTSTDNLADLPIEILSTGYPVLIVPFKSLKTLLEVAPNFEKIKNLQGRHKCFLYAFTKETKLKSSAHTRMFDPLDGIKEESATGTAGGALSCYLFKHNLASDFSSLVFEQGYSLNRPSEIKASLQVKNGQVENVKVGGLASIVKEFEINI